MTTETDLHHLRRAIGVSFAAREHGNHPFGAVLVDPSGTVVLEAENTVNTGHDVTHHAELNLVRRACASIPYADIPRHTLHTSCEPCAMCAGAIYWAGVGRVIYALSVERLLGV
jgi:tRNA(Arg) A34 adenosine deaminase TadA